MWLDQAIIMHARAMTAELAIVCSCYMSAELAPAFADRLACKYLRVSGFSQLQGEFSVPTLG